MSLASNSIILSKSDKETDSITVLQNYIKTLPSRIAFAESDNGESATGDQNKTEDESTTATDQQPKDEKQADEAEGETQDDEQGGEEDVQSEDQNKTEGEHQPEANQEGIDENDTENNTENNTDENQPEANQEGIDEIENENNNEQATHEENEQITNDVENAKNDKTVAAEVNIEAGNVDMTSIDSDIAVHIDNSTNDEVNISVSAPDQTGPKIIIVNLNSTTIDVANVKYLHIEYDGRSIAPATDINAVLHPASTDEPTYAIIITQNGAQVLVSIPHFSPHTITISKISKVIPPIPEFPIAWLTLLIAVIPIVIFSRKVSLSNKN